MDYEQIRYERRGAVALITIDRPERMNAIGARTHRELVDAWARFRDDDEALVAVLTGAGDSRLQRRGRPQEPRGRRAGGATRRRGARGRRARGWGRPLEEGLRIEAECFNRLLGTPEILEGLRRFNERDHPDLERSR